MPVLARRSVLLALFALIAPLLFYFPARLSAAPSAWSATDYDTLAPADFRADPRFLEAIDFADIDYPRLNAAVFYVTNEIRVKHGLKPLAYASALEESASGHARRMAENGFFSHEDLSDPIRTTPEKRLRLAGVANPHPAENIAETFGIVYRAGAPVYPRGAGAFSYAADGPLIQPHTYLSFADAVLESWMNSSGHRANILSTQALELGCGTRFYANRSFSGMPEFTAVQNFQWFEKIKMKAKEK